ncbi:hypothetical protein CEXT_560091 [Caerostris extrusa]|uniref:Uncharacterized protein n=1 Tax=Caerostris extrusa TaxID=172846 RepID=A0AAV4XP46_CAEEX|nr:hypothetical protein CEXT_560091 [Caerostris extrusa]
MEFKKGQISSDSVAKRMERKMTADLFFSFEVPRFKNRVKAKSCQKMYRVNRGIDVRGRKSAQFLRNGGSSKAAPLMRESGAQLEISEYSRVPRGFC